MDTKKEKAIKIAHEAIKSIKELGFPVSAEAKEIDTTEVLKRVKELAFKHEQN